MEKQIRRPITPVCKTNDKKRGRKTTSKRRNASKNEVTKREIKNANTKKTRDTWRENSIDKYTNKRRQRQEKGIERNGAKDRPARRRRCFFRECSNEPNEADS